MKFRIWNQEIKCYTHEMGCNQRTFSEFYVGTEGNIIEMIISENGSTINHDTQFFDVFKKRLVSKYKVELKLTITDRNGQELYEGDLIEAWSDTCGKLIKGVIAYYPHEEAFKVHSKNGSYCSIFTIRDIKKVGNINKDLSEL